MAYPTAYTRQYDFQSYQNANPTRPLPGDKVNADLNAVEASNSAIIDFLKQSLRSDGFIANQSVGRDQLTPDVVTRLDAMDADISALSTEVANILVVVASAVTFAPAGNVASTTVQAAITELDTEKQPIDATLTALAAVTTAADQLIYATGSDTFATTSLTTFARTFLDDADAATVRATLGLVIGTNVQAQDAELAALAALVSAADTVPYFTGSGTASLATFTASGRAMVGAASAAAQTALLSAVVGDSGSGGTKGLVPAPAAGDAAKFLTGAGTYAGSLSTFPPGGRLTLTTAVPVLSTDVTSATTIYYTPYNGIYVPLYDGSITSMISIGAELSLALDATAAHTGYHQSGKNFDLFVYSDSGTIRLVSGPAWTSDTARATALEYKNGFLCNAASMTGRFGSASGNTVTVAQDRGLYVGTFRASADGTTQWVANPASAAGGGNCQLLLYNAYNRVTVAAVSKDNTDSWAFTLLSWRSADNSTSNRVSALFGLNEDGVRVAYNAYCLITNGAAARHGYAAVGLDSTSAMSGTSGQTASDSGGDIQSIVGIYEGYAGLGFHFFQALEASTAADTRTWYGDNAANGFNQMALIFRGRM